MPTSYTSTMAGRASPPRLFAASGQALGGQQWFSQSPSTGRKPPVRSGPTATHTATHPARVI